MDPREWQKLSLGLWGLNHIFVVEFFHLTVRLLPAYYCILLYSKVNPSVLIGSFLVGIRQTDRFRGNGHMLCIFLFSKAGKLKTSMVRVSYNKLLTNLATVARAVLGNIGPRSFLYGPRCARSILPRPRANIPQYSPCAQLVRGYIFVPILGHSTSQVGGHGLFMDNIHPLNGFNGSFGFRRNTPWLRNQPSVFTGKLHTHVKDLMSGQPVIPTVLNIFQ